MNKNIKMIIVGLGLLSFIWGGASAVFAEPPDTEKSSMKEMKMRKGQWKERKEKMFQEMGVTPEQQEKLRAHRESHKEKFKELSQTIREQKKTIGEELQKEELNLDNVRQQHNELKAMKAQMEDARLEGILEVRQILTAQQFSKFMEFKKEHGGGFKGKKGFHDGHGSWQKKNEDQPEALESK